MHNFSVPKMSCGHCKSTIEKAVAKVDPEAVIKFDMAAREVRIVSNETVDTLITAMKNDGYQATPL